MKGQKTVLLCLFIVGAVLLSAGHGFCLSYKVFHLGGYLGDENGAVNNSGRVIGRYTIDDVRQAVITGPATPMVGLGTLGGYRPSSYGIGINNLGQATGYSKIKMGPNEAFFWDGAAMTGIGTLGSTYSRGYGINDRGHIAGESRNPDDKMRAFFWDGQTMKDLGVLGQDKDKSLSRARAINSHDVVVGYSQTIGFGNQAFAWDSGSGMRALGTLGGEWSAAAGINDAGQIVGQSASATGNDQAFLWQGVTMTGLGFLAGHDQSWAEAINNLGQVVGSSYALQNWDEPRAFLWENGAMVDLNHFIDPDSGWVLEKAFDISDTGMICGKGLFNGNSQSFCLVPHAVPVPTSFVLMVSGLMGLAGFVQKPPRPAAK